MFHPRFAKFFFCFAKHLSITQHKQKATHILKADGLALRDTHTPNSIRILQVVSLNLVFFFFFFCLALGEGQQFVLLPAWAPGTWCFEQQLKSRQPKKVISGTMTTAESCRTLSWKTPSAAVEWHRKLWASLASWLVCSKTLDTSKQSGCKEKTIGSYGKPWNGRDNQTVLLNWFLWIVNRMMYRYLF